MNESSSAPLVHVREHVPSTFEQLERLVETMQALADAHISDEERAYQLVLAASEAVTNAMEHGNAFEEGKRILLDARVFADRLRVIVEDEGRGFARDQVEDPFDEEHLLRPHGRGLYLIEELADEVRYEKGGRRVEMLFRRNG